MNHVHVNEIDPYDLYKEIRKLAEEKPDHIDPNAVQDHSVPCKYTARDEEGKLVGCCIFGQAFVRLGVEPEELRQIDIADDSSIDNVYDPEYSLPDVIRQYFREAQGHQDCGNTWEQSLSLARKEATDTYMRNGLSIGKLEEYETRYAQEKEKE